MRSTRHLHAALLSAAMLALPVQTILAQETTPTKSFSIRAQPLATALREFAEVTGLQLVYSPELVNGLQSAALSGDLSAPAAAARAIATRCTSAECAGSSSRNLLMRRSR